MQLQSAWKVLLLGFVVLQHLELAAGARILAPFFFPGKSHFMMSDAIVRELVKRGHEVTYITPFSLAKENLGANYIEILLPQYNFWPSLLKISEVKTVLDLKDVSTLTYVRLCSVMGMESTEFAFKQPEVQKLIDAKDKVGKYDLLLAEQFFNEGALFLAHLYQIPTITISTLAISNYISGMVGIVTPWSYVPHGWKPYTDHMSFTERIDNVYTCAAEELMRTFVHYPRQDAMLRRLFADKFDSVPSIKQMERNISVILFNTYMPLATPRPVSFNMIQVGGLHIQRPKPLPAVMQKFLDEAKHGAIYFSLGSQVRSADLSPEKLKIFLDVFGSLKQRILWKFEDEKLPNLPANVMVQKWMPQNDILAHPNVKVFIAHGGLFGTLEAVHHGVPVLGMPVFADQYLNINKGKVAGYALSVNYRTFTEQELRHSLNELLENPKYSDNMKRFSKIFRHRPLEAMDEAMFWIDYVIEHRGAPHMVSAGLDLPRYQFYLLDVIAFVAAIIVGVLLLLKYVISLLKVGQQKQKTN